MVPDKVQFLYQVSVALLTAPMYVGVVNHPSVLYALGIAVTVTAVSADPLTTPLRVLA